MLLLENSIDNLKVNVKEKIKYFIGANLVKYLLIIKQEKKTYYP